MKTHTRIIRSLILAATLTAAGSAYAAQPPDVVTSDIDANTAMGLDALLDLTTGGSNTTGSDNTADGASALYHNTTGSDNTASGQFALGRNTTGEENTADGASALG